MIFLKNNAVYSGTNGRGVSSVPCAYISKYENAKWARSLWNTKLLNMMVLIVELVWQSWNERAFRVSSAWTYRIFSIIFFSVEQAVSAPHFTWRTDENSDATLRSRVCIYYALNLTAIDSANKSPLLARRFRCQQSRSIGQTLAAKGCDACVPIDPHTAHAKASPLRLHAPTSRQSKH